MNWGKTINTVFSWLGDNVMDEVIDTTVRAGITTLINGDSFKDNFKDQAILTAADAAYGALRGKTRPKPTNPPPTAAQINAANAQPASSASRNPVADKKPPMTRDQKKWDDFYGITEANGGVTGLPRQINQPSPDLEAVKPPTAAPDSRGFFESIGDVVGGDPEYNRWESAKQAFFPDKGGDPDMFRKYGPLIGAGLVGAYAGGVFDKEKVDEAPNRPYSVGKQNAFSRPGMYRPGVPMVSGRAQGGHVNGPGTGTSDDIPAYLSDGEFVMTNEAVRGAGGGNREKGMRTMYNIMHDFERRA